MSIMMRLLLSFFLTSVIISASVNPSHESNLGYTAQSFFSSASQYLNPDKIKICVLISIVWTLMYCAAEFRAYKERSLTERLCDKEAKLFKVVAERDNLLADLDTEQCKYKRIHSEFLEIKNKFHNMSVTLEHIQKENVDLVKKKEILKNECKSIFKEKRDLLNKIEDLDKQLVSTLSDKNAEIESLKLKNNEILNELETTKSSNTILLSEKTKLEESLEQMNKMKADLTKKDQEIESLKKLVADHLNTGSDGWHESLDELLKSVELKAELDVTRNQLNDIYAERDKLIAEKSELKTNFEKACSDLLAANKARDEAVQNYQVLETYTRKTQTDLQMELGALKLKHDEIFKKNESVAEFIASLESTNKNYKEQLEDLKHQNEQDKHKRSQEYHSLETKFHMLYMDKVDITNKFEAVKKENDLLRQRLTLKSQGKSDASLNQQSSGPFSLDSAPQPEYLNGSLDATVWLSSRDSPPPPPPLPMGSWMNSSDLFVSGYRSLPPTPSANYYPGPAYMARDTYSPTSHHSHDQRSERSALSHSSANNSHHYQNYGPPQGSGSVGPFLNPLPSHWHTNQSQNQQYQPQQHQSGTSTQNDNNRSYYNSGQ